MLRDLGELGDDGVGLVEIGLVFAETEGALVAGEEGGFEAEFGGGVDVFEGVVADVERFFGGDVEAGEGVAKLFVEPDARFGSL